jgi:glutamate-ammonia-ligase adenylyltransferase
VKSGSGGLRDIEFLVQGLQLLHAVEHPELVEGNTLKALEALHQARLLSDSASAQLSEDYIFLRRVEHYLQILEDQQIHALPEDASALGALAKRMLGVTAGAEEFLRRLQECQERVRRTYSAWLELPHPPL